MTKNNQMPITPYFALVKSMILIHKGNTSDAIRILESVVRPSIRFRQYEFSLYQRFGFANYLFPTLALFETTKYDLEIYQELETLYTQENRLDDAEWASKRLTKLADTLQSE